MKRQNKAQSFCYPVFLTGELFWRFYALFNFSLMVSEIASDFGFRKGQLDIELQYTG